jgi:hypothetical protein
MNQSAYKIRVSDNPLIQFAGLIVGGLAAIAAVLLGAVLLSLLLGLALLGGAVLFARLWWLRRRMGKTARMRPRPGGSGAGDIVEVEYTVVEERAMRDDRGDRSAR